MLFLSADTVGYINATFEPAWESVRPVPIVTIDFGNCHTITRTLQGNIATYVCDADGNIYDVLPGIYTPGPYREGLLRLAALAESLQDRPAAETAAWLRAYHARELARPGPAVTPKMAAVGRTGGGIKGEGLAGSAAASKASAGAAGSRGRPSRC